MRRLAWMIAAALGAASGVAHADGPADDVAEARRLQANLEYERALAMIDQSIAHGGAAPGRLADLHELAGELAAGLDRAAVAEDHFARALALRPTTLLPEGTSPRLTGPFAAAKARGTPPLLVSASVHQGLATVAVGADPLGLVVGISVHVLDGHDGHAEIVERGALRVVVPAGSTVVEIAALDAAGNRVWEQAESAELPHKPEPQQPPPMLAPGHSRLASGTTWAVVSGVVLVGAGLCGWREHVAQTDWNTLRAEPAAHDYSALTAVESRGRDWALAANIGFGVAAAAGATAAILWLRGRGDTALAPTLMPSGAGVTLGGAF